LVRISAGTLDILIVQFLHQTSERLPQLRDKKFWEELIAYFPGYDTDHIGNEASNNSSIVACLFVTAVMFLPSRCLATIGGYFYRAVA
jgi:hypothetical protein